MAFTAIGLGLGGAALFGAGTKLVFDVKNARRAKRVARQNEQFARGLDWDPPELPSAHIPQYQRARSPVADAYINSFLLGINPAAQSPGSANATLRKQMMQHEVDGTFGDRASLMKQQQQVDASQPWAYTAPENNGSDIAAERIKAAESPPPAPTHQTPTAADAAALGMTPEQYQKMLESVSGLKGFGGGI